MDYLQSIILGLVQGLTEYLPISSTAHMRVIPALIGWPDPGAKYSAVVQLGTLFAVVIYFWKHIVAILCALVRGIWYRDPFKKQEARLGWFLILGTIPIGVFGLVFQSVIETRLRSLYVVSTALVGLALLLAVAEWAGKRIRTMHQIGLRDVLIIGFAQALALMPGTSRSGVTITAGLFVGLTRAHAARFSFLLSIPAIAASGAYELLALAHTSPGGVDWVNVGMSTAMAAISGYIAIAFLLRFLEHHSTWVFIIYRVFLGITIAGLVLLGYVEA